MKTVNRNDRKWIRPWDEERPDDLYNRDERFFSILTKGALAWLTDNIVMYGKPIRHFIFNTGSSYMYVETNGYEYSINEVTDQDMIYMHRPRCIASIGDISIDTAELTQPYIRGVYERLDRGEIRGFNAEIKRIPIQMTLDLTYVLSTFNESIILVQEIMDKMAQQRYFSVVYLGQVIQCSIEFPPGYKIDLNKIDMGSADPNNKTIGLSLNICSNYPAIDTETEEPNSNLIRTFRWEQDFYVEKPIRPFQDRHDIYVE